MYSKIQREIEQMLSMLYASQQLHPISTLLSARLARSYCKNWSKRTSNLSAVFGPVSFSVLTQMSISKQIMLILLHFFAHGQFKDCRVFNINCLLRHQLLYDVKRPSRSSVNAPCISRYLCGLGLLLPCRIQSR